MKNKIIILSNLLLLPTHHSSSMLRVSSFKNARKCYDIKKWLSYFSHVESHLEALCPHPSRVTDVDNAPVKNG